VSICVSISKSVSVQKPRWGGTDCVCGGVSRCWFNGCLCNKSLTSFLCVQVEFWDAAHVVEDWKKYASKLNAAGDENRYVYPPCRASISVMLPL
jgi:hypothetical protein